MRAVGPRHAKCWSVLIAKVGDPLPVPTGSGGVNEAAGAGGEE